jgi:hypothetical protein
MADGASSNGVAAMPAATSIAPVSFPIFIFFLSAE